MLNVIWLVLLVGSVVVAVFTGHLKEVVAAVTENAETAFKLALGFTGIMALWLGIMKIAEESGLVGLFTALLHLPCDICFLTYLEATRPSEVWP